MNDRMIVVYAASRNLYSVLPMAYMSLLKHDPEAWVICLIEDDELPYDVPVNVGTVNVSNQAWFGPDCPNIRTAFTYLSLMRVCYTKLFPGYDKVIQLDVDTVICDSLWPLWNIDLAGKYFAAVPEHLSRWKPYGEKAKYYNAGVVVFNLAKMREDKADDRLIDFLNREKVPYIDQDAINWLNSQMSGEMALNLGIRYNETPFTGESLRPAVVHAAGTKLWMHNLDEQYRGSYWKPYEQYCQWQACRDAGIKC